MKAATFNRNGYESQLYMGHEIIRFVQPRGMRYIIMGGENCKCPDAPTLAEARATIRGCS